MKIKAKESTKLLRSFCLWKRRCCVDLLFLVSSDLIIHNNTINIANNIFNISFSCNTNFI